LDDAQARTPALPVAACAHLAEPSDAAPFCGDEQNDSRGEHHDRKQAHRGKNTHGSMGARALILLASCVALTGCGGKGPSGTTTVTTSTNTGEMALKVYFLRDNALTPVTVDVPKTEAVATAAVGALLAGPPAGFETAIPSGAALESIAISNGVATARIKPASMSRTARGQLVYTLTQFPTISSVDGATRADFADLTPESAIFVEHPTRDATVTSPVHANGTADVFEGTLAVDVWSGGKRLRTQTIQASSGTGTRGNWSATIKLPSGPARLVFYEPSAENGRPLHSTEVDLTVR